jgi:hypothetical protein
LGGVRKKKAGLSAARSSVWIAYDVRWKSLYIVPAAKDENDARKQLVSSVIKAENLNLGNLADVFATGRPADVTSIMFGTPKDR